MGRGRGGFAENAEAGALHGERGEFVFKLFVEGFGGLFAHQSDVLRLVDELCLVFGGLALEGGAAFAGGGDGIESGAGFGGEGEDFRDGVAVLALEFFEAGEAGFDLFEAGRVGFEGAEVVAEFVGGVLDGYPGGLEGFHEHTQLIVNRGDFLQSAESDGELSGGGVLVLGERIIGGGDVFGEFGDVFENAALVLEFGIFAGLEVEGFDFGALEAPEVGKAELFLFGAVEAGEFAEGGLPAGVGLGGPFESGGGGPGFVEEFALGVGGEEFLLVVLAVDVAEEGGDVAEEGDGDGAGGGEGAGFASGEEFALDEEFAVFGFEAGGSEKGLEAGIGGQGEEARDESAGGAGSDHLGGGASAEQEAEGVDDERLAGAGFAGEGVETGVQAKTEAFDDGKVLDGEFDQHAA